MTTPVLALEKLYRDMQTTFAAEAGLLSAPEKSHFTGTAGIAGSPSAAAEVRILFTAPGTVGVPGITYQVSTDDGETYGPVTPLLAASSISVLGVVLTISGVVALNDFVRWVALGPALPKFAFGTREPPKRGDTLRICVVPGDDAGDAGEVSAARNPGRSPTRPLATLNELFTLWVEAFDDTLGEAEDELSQWKATRLLWDGAIRVIYKSAHGTFEVVSTEHMTERSTRRHHWTMRSVVSIQAMVPDAPAFVISPPNALQTPTLTSPGLPDDSDTPETITP
jgi:hypothetical protein